jgi:phospholipase C
VRDRLQTTGDVVDGRADGLTRRALLRAGGGLALGVACGSGWGIGHLARAAALRQPDSLPDPTRAAGQPTDALPFDHVVIVMQENHSFDSYFGMLPLRGQPKADGFTFDAAGMPINSNPFKNGYVVVQHAPSDCRPAGAGSQSWNATHNEVDGGRMDGFANSGVDSLVYWDAGDLPFYYSLATTFCLANRWFSSVPGPTYPNRRFLQAGTAYGLTTTSTSSIFETPPNGTIWDRLDDAGISWKNYYTEVPTTAIIFETLAKRLLFRDNLASIASFYRDCAKGSLPAVSMVDSGVGLDSELAKLLKVPALSALSALSNLRLSSFDEDEEFGDISAGENFTSRVVNAVLRSPQWPRILLVWCYDEHGGVYDHVPPPAAIKPDNIDPVLARGDVIGGYDVYGPRVPAVVVSPYARKGAVTNLVHDHTSILATIEAKWNLPALTRRDANAETLADFLVDSTATFAEPPVLADPSNPDTTQLSCKNGPLTFRIYPSPLKPNGEPHPQPPPLQLEVEHGPYPAGVVVVAIRSVGPTLTDVIVELEHKRRILARTSVASLGAKIQRVVLRRAHPKSGSYTIIVRVQGRVVLVQTEELSRAEV